MPIYCKTADLDGHRELSTITLSSVRLWPRRVLMSAIKGYQRVVSPVLPPSCRFWPTCSQYAYLAIEKYGALKGGWLAVKRFSRCHPLNPGGYDPVP